MSCGATSENTAKFGPWRKAKNKFDNFRDFAATFSLSNSLILQVLQHGYLFKNDMPYNCPLSLFTIEKFVYYL
jgi:hypothetical protein